VTSPFKTGDQVTVVVSTNTLARATVLDCKKDEENEHTWEVTVLVKKTSEVHTMTFRYGPQGEN